jgi:hypothetical protein
LHIGLSAEHGAFLRANHSSIYLCKYFPGGKEGILHILSFDLLETNEWRDIIKGKHMDVKWKDEILACFKKFCDNVPKAFVEAKEYPFLFLLLLLLDNYNFSPSLALFISFLFFLFLFYYVFVRFYDCTEIRNYTTLPTQQKGRCKTQEKGMHHLLPLLLFIIYYDLFFLTLSIKELQDDLAKLSEKYDTLDVRKGKKSLEARVAGITKGFIIKEVSFPFPFSFLFFSPPFCFFFCFYFPTRILVNHIN